MALQVVGIMRSTSSRGRQQRAQPGLLVRPADGLICRRPDSAGAMQPDAEQRCPWPSGLEPSRGVKAAHFCRRRHGPPLCPGPCGAAGFLPPATKASPLVARMFSGRRAAQSRCWAPRGRRCGHCQTPWPRRSAHATQHRTNKHRQQPQGVPTPPPARRRQVGQAGRALATLLPSLPGRWPCSARPSFTSLPESRSRELLRFCGCSATHCRACTVRIDRPPRPTSLAAQIRSPVLRFEHLPALSTCRGLNTAAASAAPAVLHMPPGHAPQQSAPHSRSTFPQQHAAVRWAASWQQGTGHLLTSLRQLKRPI